MSTYTHFTLEHFDGCTGEAFPQDYRWSWQTCPLQGDRCIMLETNAGTGLDPDWTFEESLDDRRALNRWIRQQAKEAEAERRAWDAELLDELEQAYRDAIVAA